MSFFKPYNNPFKRFIDLAIASASVIVLSPVLILLSFIVRIKIGRPVFFFQIRPGLNGIPFTIYKFRTMTLILDEKHNLLPDKERITPFGRFLRKHSLDELPELFNVIKGNMSLVGPRPLLLQYLSRYSPEQSRRHEVKPGVTGWAQVNGRNALTWEQKFKLDVWYTDNWSIALDTKILLLTFIKVLKKEGINHPGQETMKEFLGTPF